MENLSKILSSSDAGTASLSIPELFQPLSSLNGSSMESVNVEKAEVLISLPKRPQLPSGAAFTETESQIACKLPNKKVML